MSLLEVSELAIRYRDAVAVDDLSFEIHAGEAVGLVGESGSGKSQTALAVLGLLPANAAVSGSVRFDGTEILNAPARTLNALRATRLAMVFQDPAEALNPYLRIGCQLARILEAHKLASGTAAAARVVEMLAAVGLPDPERQSRAYPHQLSGGMRQRAMIAAALIAEPDLLIADEPTTALDVTVQAQILELLASIRANTALLLITHDLGVVAGHCERLLVLCDGRLVESGPTAAVFAAPRAAHTRALIDAAPKLGRAAGPAPAGERVLVEVENASVSFAISRRERLEAVKCVDLEIRKGETLAIVGESGSGKSSFARALLGLEVAAGGTFRFDGEPLPAGLDARALRLRRAMQLVFQDPLGSLNPQMPVAQIVAEPLTVHEPALDAAARRERVLSALALLGLDASYLGRYAHELSGGQAQRVAIARALVVEPELLVCDEAVAALDGTVRRRILDLFEHLQRRSGLSLLFISHDLGIVREISHRVIVMYLGRVVEAAETATLFARPRHPYTRALLDAVPRLEPDAPPLPRLAGEVPSALDPPPGCVFHPRCRYAEDICRREAPAARELDGTRVACHRAAEIDLAY